MFDIKGKNAIVTGGSGDLGWSIVECYLSLGARVIVIDINNNPLELGINKRTIEKYPKNFKFISADISDKSQIESSFSNALSYFEGNVDILVNSAGIQRRYSSEVFPEKDWDDVIAVNLTATFLYSKLASQIMVKHKSGKIINIASMQSFFGGVTIPAYAASKGGVAQLTKAFSNDLSSRGINVNAIAPGYMDTKLNTALKNNPERFHETMLRIPMNRWGRPEDIAGLAVFLASKASDYITGAIIPVDGGFSGR